MEFKRTEHGRSNPDFNFTVKTIPRDNPGDPGNRFDAWVFPLQMGTMLQKFGTQGVIFNDKNATNLKKVGIYDKIHYIPSI